MGNRPVIILKHLNQFIPNQHFKIEGLHCLRNILKKGDYMCKLDLKDAYFSVPLNPASRKFVWFLWSGKLYEFLCLCFGLGPAPRIFTKLHKVAVLHRLNILIIIYLDDMLLIGHTIGESLIARDSNLLSSITRFCTEFKEISVDTYTENRVLTGDSRFINHDPVSTREESLKSSEAV